jgi:hypothetical protein
MTTTVAGAQTLPPFTITASSPTLPPGVTGVSAGRTPDSQTTPTTTLATGQSLTTADAGSLVSLRVGQQLPVELPPGSAGNWGIPTVQGWALVMVSHSGGYPSDTTPLRATFTAKAPGAATILVATDMACFHMSVGCSPAVGTWSVTVQVTP